VPKRVSVTGGLQGPAAGLAYGSPAANPSRSADPTQECPESRLSFPDVAEFALPNHERRPALRLKPLQRNAVTLDGALELLQPIAHARLWGRCPPTTLMPVPEAAVNEDHRVGQHPTPRGVPKRNPRSVGAIAAGRMTVPS
jgi:hypothetical protein